MKITRRFPKSQKGDGEPAPNYLIFPVWIQIRDPGGQNLKLLSPY